MTDTTRLLADLTDETADLDRLVAPLSGEHWHAPTPAVGWDVAMTITHLHRSDLAGIIALDGGDLLPTVMGVLHPSYDGNDLRGDWLAGAERLAERLADLPAGARIPWYGPAMSQLGFITARIMETWAHGQDVADALGLTRAPTDRLRHVCEIGVRTRGWSYAIRGRVAPDASVRVDLTGPAGDTWSWGPEQAQEQVRGTAEDFALLVTQRRHRDDLDLVATGDAAREWLTLAQAFAGGPTEGRSPLADR